MTHPDHLRAVREKLEALACLGNEPMHGNSIGNHIAQDALKHLTALESLSGGWQPETNVERAYFALLHEDFKSTFRIHNQDVYARLRDCIADRRGVTNEEVQNLFEQHRWFPAPPGAVPVTPEEPKP